MTARRTSVLLHVAEVRTTRLGEVVLVLEGGDRVVVTRPPQDHERGSRLAYVAALQPDPVEPYAPEATDHVATAHELAELRRVARAGRGVGLRNLAGMAF